MANYRFIFYTCFILLAFSCKVDPKIIEPLPAGGLTEVVPQGWPQPVYTFSSNTLTENKFILGRALFYENLLSKDNSISCGSCHQNFAAFANADHKLSHGVNDLLGNRNSPGLFNLNWYPTFMHDGGVNHIEVQPVAPISNPVEMAENITNVVAKLQASEKYKKLFTSAYGSDTVTTQRMFRAMAQFMGMMYSYNSKYDHFKRSENKVTFSDQEARGYALFLANCNSCHKEPLFSDFAFRNNGLGIDPFLKDSGRAHITGLPQDRYTFKTPSLRNLAVTGPYMHDGRFSTLEQCLDHYTNGKANLTNLDPLLQNPLPLSAQDKKDIIVFLNTLTDHAFLTDERFSDPNFK